MMKFKRWKKMIVMLLIATMFLQSVVVYADDGTSTMPSQTETSSDAQAAANDELTTSQTPSDGSSNAEDPADQDGKGDADNPADTSGKGNADNPADTDGKGDADNPDNSNGKGDGEGSKEVTKPVDGEVDDNDVGADEETDEEAQETEPVNEEVPEEVKAFLEAVEKLPAPEDVTKENAEEIGEQVNAVFDLYDMLVETNLGYKDREDVVEAMEKAYAVFEAVLEAEEIDDNCPLGNYWDPITGDSLFDATYNIFAEDGNLVYQFIEGLVQLNIDVPVGGTYVDEGVMLINDKGYDIYEVVDWSGFDIWSTNENVLKIRTEVNGKTLRIIYEGVGEGTAGIMVAFNLRTEGTGQGIYGTKGLSGAAACGKVNIGRVSVGEASEPGAPRKPNTDEINYWSDNQALGIRAACVNYNVTTHKKVFWPITVATYPESYSLGGVKKNTGSNAKQYPWTCTLTVNNDWWAKRFSTYNKVNWPYSYGTHRVDTEKTGTLTSTFYWNGAKWVNLDEKVLTVWVTCTPEEVKKTSYTIKHEYYTNGSLDGSTDVTIPNVEVGKKINASDITKVLSYQGTDYKYTSTTPESLTLTTTAEYNVITLRYDRETAPNAPTEKDAEDVLKGKYIVKVKCTNEMRKHTLAEKDYSITAADITSISEVKKNESGKWEVEVWSSKNTFISKFDDETNVKCKHDEKSGGFSVKLVWNGSAWTYADTYTRTVETECHPTKNIPYTVVYKAYKAEENGVSNLPASETKQGTAPGSVDFSVSSQIPTRKGYEFAGWAVQGTTKKGGDTLTVTGSASADSVTENLYATWTKKPDAPVIPGQNGKLRVQVVCDSEESSHKGKKENLRLRKPEDNDGIIEYTGGEVVKTDKSGYDWEYTVTLYKSDFADRFVYNKEKDHEYVKETKDTVNVTFYYKNGKWDYANFKDHNSSVEIVYEKNGSDDYYCNYVVYHVEPQTTTKTPKIEVKKSNTNFKVDPESGNAKVDYTITIKNVSGFDIYGLRLTDTLTPILTKKGNGEGTPSATYTFGNWKVDGKDITPRSGEADELEHELGLLPRNTIFKDQQTVKLTYTVEIEANDVPVEVKLENKADVDSWSEVYTPSKLAKVAAALFMKTRTADDDIGYPDDPDIHGGATSTTGGDVSGSGSSTAEGELPAKYTLTYDWNLPKDAIPAKTLPTDTRESRPAGSHFTVDTVNKAGDEVTGSDGKTYVFSGWQVPDDVSTEEKDGDHKGQYVMPDHAVVITGEWTLKEDVPQKPTKEDLQQVGVVIRCLDDSKHDSGTEWWKLGGEQKDDAVVAWKDTWRTIGEVTKVGDTYQCVVTLYAEPWADMRINGSTLTKIKEEKGIEHIFDEVKTGGKEIPVTFTYENGTWTADKKTVEVWLKENYMYTVTVNHLGDNGHNFWTGYDPTYGLKVGENYNHSFDESMTALQYPNKPDVKSPKAFNIGENHYVLDPMADNTPEEELEGIMGKENVIINLYYSLDVKGGDDPDKLDGGPDGIPDKYQTKVTFKVVNGNWNDDTEDDVVKYVVKYKEVDGKQVMAADGTATLDGITIPEAGEKPDPDFKVGTWDTEPTKDTKVTSDTIYTYTYVKDNTVTITIKFVDEDGNEVGSETKSVEKDSKYDVTEETEKIPDGYEPNGDPEGDPVSGTADANKTITVPVKTITYTVTYTDGVNGTAFTDQVTTDLKKGAMTPAFDGTPSRSGYTFEGWTPAVADIVTDNATYTAQWTLIPENPTTPPGGGGGGGTGGGGTPDPTPTPPIPEITPLIPEIVPAVGPTTTVVPNVTPVAATPVAPTPTAALVSPTPEAVELADEAIPLAAGEEKEQSEPIAVDEEKTPLAGGRGAAWALINFALMNLAIFESVMLLIGYFVKTKNDGEEEKRKLKKKGIFRIISLPIAVISLIVFILTEDITLPTAFVDKYTIVMLIIAIVQTVMVALSNKKYEDEEEA